MASRTAGIAAIVAVTMLAACVTTSYACMSFRVTAKDGNIMIGRTMEFGVESHWTISLAPRNMQFTSPAPGGKKGHTWKNKYGYLGVIGWGMENMVADGMNEAGLSFGGLWYEPDTKYQEVGPGEEQRALAQIMCGSWILGNFATVDEVKKAVADVKIFGLVVPALGIAPTAHCIIYDAGGNCVVMEFEDGVVKMYDNPLGILTNSPNFPWHVNNLRQYIGMSNEDVKPRDMSGVKLIPTGHGAGMIGLPGDLTPPSRFVRVGVTTHFADQPDTVEQALNVCQHIVNGFCIVSGVIVERSEQGKVIGKETTQFVSYRDLKNRIFYFQTYENPDLRKIDLRKVDFTGDKVKLIQMNADTQAIKDVTGTAK